MFRSRREREGDGGKVIEKRERINVHECFQCTIILCSVICIGSISLLTLLLYRIMLYPRINAVHIYILYVYEKNYLYGLFYIEPLASSGDAE